MIRAVLDANVLIAATINVKSSVTSEIYQNFLNQSFTLIVSPEMLEEVKEVINRDRIVKRHKRSLEERQAIINELAELSYLVPGNTKVEVVRDPDDNKMIVAGIEGRADYIVTRDRDLIDLKEYQGIKIITPEEFMGILRAEN